MSSEIRERFRVIEEPGSAGTAKFMPVTIVPLILFFLIFSGPPKFRVREADASLHGELDMVLVIQVIIWLLAGAWIALQLWRSRSDTTLRLRLMLPHKVTLFLIALLAAESVTSLSVPLTLFKVYQIAVEFLFCLTFIEWHGIGKFLQLLMMGNLALCTVIGVLAVAAPSIVYTQSETGAMRLDGDLIAGASGVAAFSILLLFGRKRVAGFWFWLAISSGVLIASLSRNAWVGVGVFFVLAIWRRPVLPHLKTIYVICAALLFGLLTVGTSYLNNYRDPESIYTLSDRLGLWAYLTDAVLNRSPVFGLGYVAGARALGPEYNPGLGSAHSLYFEVFVGGGFTALFVFLLLIALLLWNARKLLTRNCSPTGFTVAAMLLVMLVMGFVGGELESTPSAFTFWGIVSALPLLSHFAVTQRASLPTGIKNLQSAPETI